MSASPIGMAARLEPEERLRADLYALFARLFVAPPDAELLRLIGSSPLIDGAVADSAFVRTWARLCAAASVMDPDAAADEYDALFGGIGHSEISLFASHYVGEGAPGAGTHFLVDLRVALARRGVDRKPGETLPEDHCSALLESMRLLIEEEIGLPVQHEFFDTFVAPWKASCCSAIASHRLANFYKTVAECVTEFLAVEAQSFQIA
jgi:TorA maturation chaperone TorD